MGYVVHVKSNGKRFEQWTGKVHSTRAGALIEMNKGKETYKSYSYKSHMKDIVRGAKWEIRKVAGRTSSPFGTTLKLPTFRF